MKFLVEAKIGNSYVLPVKEFTAEKEFEFDNKSNVFERVYEVRNYFKNTYGQNIDLEIIKAKEIGV